MRASHFETILLEVAPSGEASPLRDKLVQAVQLLAWPCSINQDLGFRVPKVQMQKGSFSPKW